MNWDAIGAVGEIMGAAAVVVTLVYLSVQVKQNSAQIRLNSSQTAINAYSGRIREVLSDPELLPLFRNGLNDYSNLGPDDRARFHAIMLGFHTSYLQNVQFLEEGVITNEIFQLWENDWIRILKCNGSQQWWQWVQTMMTPEKVAAMDTLIENSSQQPLNTVVDFLKAS